jgi:peptide-methionine (S)-S-oxide reductase
VALVRAIARCCAILSYAHFNIISEYRSAIFYTTPEQKEVAEKVTQEVQEK